MKFSKALDWAVLLPLALLTWTFVAQPSPAAPRAGGLFSHIRMGQMVEVASSASDRLQIKIYDDPNLAKLRMVDEVKEIGDDFLVLKMAKRDGEDFVRELHVPFHSIAGILFCRSAK
jgi:hypothetical protein